MGVRASGELVCDSTVRQRSGLPPPPEHDEQGSTYILRPAALAWYPPAGLPGPGWAVLVVQKAYFGDDLWLLPLNWCVIQL